MTRALNRSYGTRGRTVTWLHGTRGRTLLSLPVPCPFPMLQSKAGEASAPAGSAVASEPADLTFLSGCDGQMGEANDCR
jgi:hypothetical protein